MEIRFNNSKRGNLLSHIKTLFRNRSSNHPKTNNAEIVKIVDKLQQTYYGHDPIISTFSTSRLMSNIDLICRAYSISLTRPIDTSYILSKLSAASIGIQPEERREIFLSKNLNIRNEVSYWDNRGQSVFYFCSYGNTPYLLIRHEHGTSVMNATESVLESIQNSSIEELGFHLVRDSISIFVKDVLSYYKVEVDETFENPKWEDLTDEQQKWFNDEWEHLDSLNGELEVESPLFFGKDRPYTAYKHIRRLFMRTTNELFVVDPYVNDDLFTMFEIVPASVEIRLLASNYQKDSKVIAKRFRRERGNFDFRQSNKLHDRYLFCDKHCYLFGSSLNNFGALPTTIVPMHDRELGTSVRRYFDEMWRECDTIT